MRLMGQGRRSDWGQEPHGPGLGLGALGQESYGQWLGSGLGSVVLQVRVASGSARGVMNLMGQA